MRKALPVITEEAVLLKRRLQGEHHGRKRPRLQMRNYSTLLFSWNLLTFAL
jgi:hypothetical protein